MPPLNVRTLVPGTVRQADQVEPLAHRPTGRPAIEVVESRKEEEILGGGQVLEERDFLGDEANLSLERVGVAREAPAVHQQHRSGVGRKEPGDHRDGGGLSGAVGPEQTNGLPARARRTTASTAVTDPKRLVAALSSSMADTACSLDESGSRRV